MLKIASTMTLDGKNFGKAIILREDEPKIAEITRVWKILGIGMLHRLHKEKFLTDKEYSDLRRLM